MKKNAEWKLIQEARKGDQKAWADLYAKHSTRVYNVIYRLVRDVSTAEDLAQDTFFSVHKNLKDFKGEAAFSTWIHRIAVNTALMHLRRKGLYLAKELDFDIIMPGIRIDHKLMHKDALLKAMSGLSPKRKLVVVWKAVEGLTHEEIGKILGTTTVGSKSMYHVSIVRMRRSLIRQGYKRGDDA